MEVKYRALCVKTDDYKENDKLITLVTAERGKILASAKSVKKINSKLKLPCTAPCYGEYILTENVGRHAIIGCSLEECFLGCWQDIKKYSATQIVLEVLEKTTEEGMDASGELKKALIALTYINHEDISPFIFSLWFLTSLFPGLGIDLRSHNTIPPKYLQLIIAISDMQPSDLGTLEITSGELYKMFVFIGHLFLEDVSVNICSLKEALKML
ncbi:MAG: DNA repair protein RecO [Clostridia bacterium]|nr:DNA repair protein RecO [Clostridia bacterium]